MSQEISCYAPVSGIITNKRRGDVHLRGKIVLPQFVYPFESTNINTEDISHKYNDSDEMNIFFRKSGGKGIKTTLILFFERIIKTCF